MSSPSIPLLSIISIPPLLLFLLLLQFHETASKGLALPLRTLNLQSTPIPNKLRFHHNVTLTVSLFVGTPPQNLTMVLDTGSELSWLLCDSPSLSSFHPRASSSYSPIPCSSPTCKSQTRDLPNPSSCDSSTLTCHVSLSYADASTAEGSLSSDVFLLGRPPSFRTAFGCMTSTFSSAAGDPSVAGLLGMNRGALSFITQTNTSRFSYCISDRNDSGLLLLGHSTLVPLNYTPLVQLPLPLPYFDRVAYSVQLDSISVGPRRLPIPKSVLMPDHTGAGQTMVDSGTRFSFLLGPAYEILKKEFLRQTEGVLTPLGDGHPFQEAFDLCFRAADAAALRRVPAVVLGFIGAEVAVEGERLLHSVEGADGVWCFTFGNSDLVPVEAYIIGHHHQQNIWVEYDLENNRVGFAPVRCELASQKLGVLL